MNYYIQGSPARADKIKAAFKKLGYDTSGHLFNANSVLYFTLDGEIRATTCNCTPAIIKTHPDYKELELPVKPKFKAGDWLVYRNGDTFAGGFKEVQVQTVEEINRYTFTHNTNASCNFIDRNCRLWTISDAKDGDILATGNGWTFIFKAFDGCRFSSYCFIDSQNWFCEFGSEAHTLDGRIIGNIHPATKEQRVMLFAKMKEAGYEWDAEKKELRKIINPKFKVGDKIEATIYGIKRRVTIREVDKTNRCYFGTLEECIGFSEQDQWHLAPKPHYDIANFKAGMPVLVRDKDCDEWVYTGYSHFKKNESTYKFRTTAWVAFIQCIPFEGNEHLLGTTDPCDEQYINW